MAESGAKAALRGYRLQALYVLALVLREHDSEAAFHLEGQEDVDVYLGGMLRRTIQVKAHQTGLSLSDLKPRRPDSFLHRAGVALVRDAEVEIATFGPLGSELAGAWAGEVPHRAVVQAKLLEFGFGADEVARLFDAVRLVPVEEAALQREVFAYLSEVLTGTDPEAAFELLSYWVYHASEERQRITRADVIERVERVGRYVSERAARHAEWFTTIVPLMDEPPPAERAAALAEEFRLGVSARYEHILADQDVLRTGKMEEIEAGFRRSRVVLVHGASGQGKTTLALRYLHDYVPAEWRFSVRAVQDRRHALQVAAALAGHLRAVSAPIYVYLDVSPREVDWPDLVRALLAEENVRILVTIREEDLARLEASDRELDFPVAVPLELDRSEAEEIYVRLEERRTVEAFLSFDEAWARFGEKGPLLEFVHLLTESETLEQTLRKQVDRLRREQLSGHLPAATLTMLRIASVAGAYESRVELRGLVEHLRLDEPAAILARLEKEYLLRATRDGRFLEPLHPLRSVALSRVLEDPALHPWEESAVVALDLMPESDLEGFLLHAALDRDNVFDRLLDAISLRTLKSWAGLAGVARAILWRSLRQYVSDNATVIEEAREWNPDPWIALAFDVSGIGNDPYAMQRLVLEKHPEAFARIKELQDRQIDPNEIWTPLGQWFATRRTAPRPPVAPREWAAFAEMAYWCLRERGDVLLNAWIFEVDLTDAVDTLPLALLGDVFTALAGAPPNVKAELFARHGERLRERCREDMRLLALVEEPDGLRAHFIVPLDTWSAPESDAESKHKDRLNELASECVVRLGQLVPGYNKYGTFGYGWRSPLVELPWDPTEKLGEHRNFILPRWGLRANAIFHGLVDLPVRPATWREYVDRVVDTRSLIVDAFDQLRSALVTHFTHHQNPSALTDILVSEVRDDALQRTKAFPKLPRAGIDPWGRVWEGQDLAAAERAEPAGGGGAGGVGWGRLVLQRHRHWLDAAREYRSAVTNFLVQCTGPLKVNCAVRQPKHQRAALTGLKRTLGYDKRTADLSLHNLGEARNHLRDFQCAFRERYGNHVQQESLDRLESRETEVVEELWTLWRGFVAEPRTTFRDPVEALRRKETDALRWLRRRLETGLRRVPSETANATILSEAISWEGQRALWIGVELSDPFRVADAIEAVHGAVKWVFGRIKRASLEAYMTERAWPHILVLPTVDGRRMLPNVWRFATANLYLGYFGAEENAKIPVPLPATQAAELSLEPLDFLARPEVERLEIAWGELYEVAAHVADIARVPVDLDEIGRRVEEAYSSEVERIAADRGRAIGDAFSAAAEAVISAAADQETPLLADILVTLRDAASLLSPPAESHPDRLALDWEEGLREALGVFSAVRLALIAHTMGIEEVLHP